MSLRVRMVVFLTVLVAVAVWNPAPPAGIVVACGVYVALILPKLDR